MIPQQENQLESLLHKGPTTTFLLPDRVNKVTIREQNGNDEDILSNIVDEKGTNILNFIASIVTDYKGKRVTADDVKTWPLKNKYYTLLKSRIHSLGPILKFPYICSSCSKENSYSEDLNLYDGDFSDDKYEPKTPWSIKPYTRKPDEEGWIYFTTKSNKELRYKMLDTDAEFQLLEKNKNSVGFTSRSLQLNFQNEWVPVYQMQIFSPADMAEIRGEFEKADGSFVPLTKVTCPHCKNTEMANILLLPAFFYPTEI